MSATDARDGSTTRRPRSTSRSRPTTPLRPSSRSSFRESAQRGAERGGGGPDAFPLDAFEPAFAELSDAVADLEANMMHFQLMHESLARFSESFASFLYGLNMNAFCVDFPEAPITESFRRAKLNEEQTLQPGPRSRSTERGEMEGETTFMTTDMSFVENPVSISKPTPKKFAAPETRQSRMPGPSTRGGGTQSRGRGAAGRGRGSGLIRPRVRGLK
ncbi:DASH complex subunit Dam1-domain-containing protein [Biscogniauxia mediterranea]|nr:DASH complex subunit Dam1-domain-containing protein [Biscogniauxia mediterranea]